MAHAPFLFIILNLISLNAFGHSPVGKWTLLIESESTIHQKELLVWLDGDTVRGTLDGGECHSSVVNEIYWDTTNFYFSANCGDEGSLWYVGKFNVEGTIDGSVHRHFIPDPPVLAQRIGAFFGRKKLVF